MSEAIVVALITGGLSLAGVIVTCLATSKKAEKAAAVAQAITETTLNDLTREVREHNNFAQKVPVLEQEVRALNHRVSSLEQYHNAPIN
jgi:ubiquinone biosynthesis protein UbiJ